MNDNKPFKRQIKIYNQPLLLILINALIEWKNSSPMDHSSSSEDNLTTNTDFNIFVIDLYTLKHTTIIHWMPDTKAAVALVQNRYIGVSPQALTLAFSVYLAVHHVYN
ncbi:hypothetical protein BDN71DRAFT_1510391 [Pleurotus eryngii]|uniref:Uncharacterized protein n=1 Tax=Pleurotus eryngii TaxID=5323 RepID=A0A9P5ZN73_PLEER|nr:hypothetical protein BDN71DRAFT_1510391 [Pleurotus eryngii]